MRYRLQAMRAASVLAAAMWLAAQNQPAMAEMRLPAAPQMHIEYKEPANPAHRRIYERLKNRKVLEQYKEFMSPLQFNRALAAVTLQGCDGKINAWYSPQTKSITYCYELVADIERTIAQSDLLPGFRREDAVVGAFVGVMLHETGHAIFDLLDVPIFGREEDAADAIAGFVILQVGKSAARRVLAGFAFFWRAWELEQRKGGGRTFEDYLDEHGTHAQRFYNLLCIAIGSDLIERSNTFADFVPLMGKRRIGYCAQEYRHAKNSFVKLVLPRVNQTLMRKVQATEWIRSEDGADILPPGPTGPGPGGGPGGGPGPGPGGGPGGGPGPGPGR
jgi:hypothetical protein